MKQGWQYHRFQAFLFFFLVCIFLAFSAGAFAQNHPATKSNKAGSTPGGADTRPSTVTSPVDWIRQHAIALTTVEAGHGFTDMQPLKRTVADARIVALGEA